MAQQPTKKTKTIAFRLTDDEYKQIEEAAVATGEDPNEWCRSLSLAQSSKNWRAFDTWSGTASECWPAGNSPKKPGKRRRTQPTRRASRSPTLFSLAASRVDLYSRLEK